MHTTPLYTGQKALDMRLSGSVADILRVGDTLHEYTPYLSAFYHSQEGILFARIDEDQRTRMNCTTKSFSKPSITCRS